MGLFSKEKKEESDEEPLETGEATEDATPETKPSRAISLLDFVMRILAIIGTLASAIALGTINRTLPSFNQFIRFTTGYQDFPTFRFFMVSNAIACAYLVLSLALSVLHILKSGAKVTRAVLIMCDTIILALLTAGGSAATTAVYLAHHGNDQGNWLAICQQNNSVCKRVTGSLVGSFIGALLLLLLITLSAVGLSKQ